MILKKEKNIGDESKKSKKKQKECGKVIRQFSV